MNGAVDKCVGIAGEYPNCVCGNKEASPEPMIYSFICIHQSSQLRSPSTKVGKI